jgi:hypothetical protein
VAAGRYGQPPPPKGFTSQLNEALAAHLDVGANYLDDLRKLLAAYQRGENHGAK